MKWLWRFILAWVAINLVPYAVAGETWGMVWFKLNLPLSLWLKSSPLCDIGYPVLYIAAATALNGLALGLLISAGMSWKKRRV
ncbi:hypothetical protein [Prosthecobacter sp.]|uniref:hypothetical protein n=1 Tax=Prosthecobacter sp. TaxID=1965333 RepID=UPI0037849630